MSIYTITLKRELLSSSEGEDPGDEDCGQANWFERDLRFRRYEENSNAAQAASASSSKEQQNCSAASKHDDSPAGWQCLCGGASLESDRPGNKEEEKGLQIEADSDNTEHFKENSVKHSAECLESWKNFRESLRNRRKLLQEQANQIEHSINVTLEVAANLKQPNRIVWFKNNTQLTSSEKPIYFAKRRKLSSPSCSQTKQLKQSTGEQQASISSSTKRTISSKTSASAGSQSITTVEEKEEIVEEVLKERVGGQEKEGGELVKKCEQVSSDKGSKLTIHDLQDDDYGQYTCKLIDLLDGHQYSIHTQLKEDKREEVEESLKRKRLLNLKAISNMDEVIEVKEGDLNIELGIQILPETNEDEELMSEEEKADFIKNTTISWFKDDTKLNEKDPDVCKLFQFTYDQNEGFHRLIVRKATKETEGLYTCLVENESGTSSCTTQLVVGPGNLPKLTSRLQDVTVYVGQTLEFRIKSTGLPPIDSCQWFRDDKLIIELDSKSSRKTSVTSTLSERITMTRDEEIPPNWSGKEEDKVIIFKLCIENLKLDDTGRYKCRIINEYGYDETDSFVKVLQEIIEEHEEIEETIEETTRLGGGKKSTREEEEEETTTTVVGEEETVGGRRSTKRSRQAEEAADVEMSDGEGQAPRFRRLLSDTVILEETEEIEEELILSTERNKWSNSSEQLKVRWFADDIEISRESSEYSVENFYDETSEELFHKLIIKRSSAARNTKRYTCRASNSFGEAETSCQVRQARKPRFLRTLEDTETSVGETIVIKVALDAENSLDDLSFSKDDKIIYSSKVDGENKRDIVTNSKSRIRVRSYEETIEEETTTTSRYSSRRSSRAAQKRAKFFELTIENVQVDQMGTWECRASNKAGEASCKADIEVFAEPKIVTDLPEEVRVSPGKEIRLTVEASGSPIPVYSWFKDGIGIAEEEDRVYTETKSSTRTTTTTSSRRRSSVTSMRNEDGISISGETLIIRDARPEDAGSYSCIVENRLGRVQSRDNKLTVTGHGDDLNSAPRIIKDFSLDQIIKIEEGENVILKVLAEGHPKPKQRWFKNDTEEIIERVSRFEIETEGEEYKLKIKRSQLSDSGKYKVSLKNDFGETESRRVEIRVVKCTDEVESQRRESAPTILLDSQDKCVGLNSNISFDVQVGGHPKPFITWYKNGRKLTESSDGRVSFIEEETITTITEEEEDLTTGERVQKTRKETSTMHRLVINNVKESDEAIYSLKAENEFGSTKSSLVSLTVDKRKEAVDEISERKKASKSKVVAEEEEEETTVTTEVTTTTTKDELEDTLSDVERRRRRTSTKRSEDEEEDLDEDGKRLTKTRTTRTTTTKTTTTRTEEEDEEEAERRRREAAGSSKKSSISESDRRSKRRVLVEEEEEEEIEEQEKVKQRRTRVEEQEEERKDEEVVKTRRLVERDEDEAMQVDEENLVKDKSKSKRKTSKRDSVSTSVVEDETEESKRKQRQKERRRDSRARLDETKTETHTERSTEVTAPRLISAPKKVVAGLGSSPEVEVEVEETVVEEETITRKVVWTKNDQPIPDRLIRDSHIELIEKPTSQPGVKKHILRINSLRSSDAGSYKLKVENPAGAVETEPIDVEVDRSMRPGEKAQATPAEIKAPSTSRPLQPQVVSVPEEIVAGVGSSPQIEAELRGEPKPETTWFKDGQPISDAELKNGHLEIVDLPSDKPDITKQALKINNLKPADVAAYHVKAENPLGEAESEPTNLRIDRSMGPKDEPQITRGPIPMEVDDDETSRPSSAQPRDDDEIAPSKRPAVEKPQFPDDERRRVEAPIGSSPVVEIPVKGGVPDKLELLKDGRPVDVNEEAGPGKKPHVELERLPDGTERLRINELRPTDEGVYTLKASNKAGAVESAPIEVVAAPEEVGAPTRKPSSARQPSAPQVLNTTKEVVAGPGSEPELEVVIKANPEAAITWFKDGKPLTERQLSDGHLTPLVDRSFEGKPDVCKYTLKVDKLRTTDQAEYHLVAKNPLGTTECKPIKVKLDRTMRPSEAPQVTKSEEVPTIAEDDQAQVAPTLLSLPEEVVAAPGSSPILEAEIESVPKAKVQWFKDGQPINARQLREGGHLEAIEEPTGVPGVTKHALKINDVKPVDVAAYHLTAENPLGELESEPINLRLDRSMRPTDEPVVTPAKGLPQTAPSPSPVPSDSAPSRAGQLADEIAPLVISDALEVAAGIGSSPVLGVDVKAQPEAAVTWLKDGEPISPRLLRDGHIEQLEESSPAPGVTRHSLKINDARPSDAAEYKLKAENPLGESESEPIKLKIDRTKGPNDKPKVVPNPRKGSLAAPDDIGEQVAPKIVSLPKEVVAGLGSSPQLEAEVSGKPAPEIQWLKDGQPISERQLRDGNLEVVDLPTDKPDTVKQALKINDLRPSDAPAAGYQVKAENPAGVAESEPIKVQVDRSMSSSDKPIVKDTDSVSGQSADDLVGGNKAPTIVSMPEEVVAGRGSSPALEAEVTGKPTPEITWFKDGQPITERQLQDGHLEIVKLPTERPDTVKQALKINDLKPADAAAYHVKAENPLGKVESEPTNVRIDRSLGPRDEPVIIGGKKPQEDELLGGKRPSKSEPSGQRAPTIVSAPEEIVAGPRAAAAIVAEVAGKPAPEITWFKDGQPIPERQLRDGHLEVVDLPTDKPDTTKQALKINDLRPADVAAYHVKAENPFGEAESEPTNVRIDRSMRPSEEPIVTGGESLPPATSTDLAKKKRPSASAPGGQSAPQILSAPEEVVAGPGSTPVIEAVVAGKPEPEVTWFKDGQPITDRQLRDGHLEVVKVPTDQPDTTKQVLKINNLKPADVAAYHIKAENPLGEAESEPTNLRIDRSMGPRDEPVVKGLPGSDKASPLSAARKLADTAEQVAPTIVSVPEEVVAGVGSNPVIVAEATGKPAPDITWFKDGQPITDAQLNDGHLEVVNLPSDKPDTTKQALKINQIKPADVAAYHVKAENPLGEAESEPTNVRIDRSMGPRDEPVVKGLPEGQSAPPLEAGKRPEDSGNRRAPSIVGVPKEVVGGPGSCPLIEAEVVGKPTPEITWFKDGQPITERQLRDGHLEVVDLPTDKPDTIKQALKVNNLKPADVAAYHLKAENPLGEAESAPIGLKIDRSLGPRDEPIVKGLPETETASPLGAARKPADTEDQVAPSIVSMPEEVVAGVGSNPAIVAEATGKPAPDITWFKDGQPITDRQLRDGHLEIVDVPTGKPDTTKQALKITDLKPTDVAAYHVKAENPLGDAESNPTNLRVDRSMGPRDKPVITGDESKPSDADDSEVPMDTTSAEDGNRFAPKIVSVPKEVVAALGSNPVLDVEIKSNPEAKVSWFKDGQPIPARLLRDGHIEQVKQSTPVANVVKHSLVVHDLRPSDVAAYTAKAENPLGEAESAPIKLRADRSMSKDDEPITIGDKQQVAPEIVSMPEEVVAGVGSSPTIEAVIKGEPKPETTWFKDGQPISSDELAGGHLELVEQPGTAPDTIEQALKINNLKPADVAAYHVKAENPLGEAESEPTNLRIDRSMGPKDEPKVTGEGAQPTDQEGDQPTSGRLEKPRLPQLARNIKSPVGSSPVLDVEVTGGQPDEIEWLKDGQVVKDAPDMHIELEQLPGGTQKLQINNLRPSDEGVYKVRATNAAGSVESGPIKLSVDRRASLASPSHESGEELPAKAQFAPEIINLTEELVAGAGSAPALEVEVKASPKAEVTWFKDGRPLTQRQLSSGHLNAIEEKSPYSPEVTKYQLQVDELKLGDVGTYHVVAKNPLGTVESKPMSLKVDKSMAPNEAPQVAHQVAPAESIGDLGEFAPQVVSMTEEVVAGVGSSPIIEAQIKAKPEPTTSWFKDGQPITEAQLADEHLEIVREKGPEPDSIKETLKINGLKPADVAAYHVRAENPLGEVESEPTNLRIDRSMGPQDEPVVSKAETPFSPEEALQSRTRAQAPTIRKIPRKIVAALGSNPAIEVEISGVPKPEVVWFKDGRQVADTRGHIALIELPNGVYRLSVTNLKAVDQGDYTVRATNEAGEVQSAPIALVIDTAMSPREGPHVFDSDEPEEVAAPSESVPAEGSFAPKIVRVSDKIVAPLGSKARVEVEVKASPEADVSWFKDGQPIASRLIDEGHIQISEVKSPSEPDQTSYCLEVSDLRPSDAAVYHLEAENPLGSVKSPSVGVSLKKPTEDEEKASPKLKLRAPVIKRAPRQVVAAVGTSPTIEVEVSGEPVPEIVWLRNGRRIERTDAHFTMEAKPEEGVYRLTVNEVQLNDEAVYSVQATNEAGTVESGPIELKVEDSPSSKTAGDTGFAPQVLSVTDEVVAKLSTSLAMEVLIQSSPRAEITWFKDGLPLTEAEKRKLNISETVIDSETTKCLLKIKQLRPSDVAAYHVRASNPFGTTDSVPINVRIDRSGDEDEGDTAAVKPEDSGASYAPADGDQPGKRKLRAPVIKKMPRKIVAGIGSSPVIEIEISGEPKPEIIWYKNGRRVTEVTNHISFEEGPDSVYRLCFTNLKATDQAEYSVTATNEAGTVDSGPIQLVVDRSLGPKTEPFVQEATELPASQVNLAALVDGPIEAPVILRLQNQEALPGQTVKLEAEVLGNPKPEIKWLKDGDEVELNILNTVPDSNVHSLTLNNVNDLYDGVYSLEAKNLAGVARKDATVRIVDQLSPEAQKVQQKLAMEPTVETPKRREPEEPREKPFIKKGLKFSQVNQGRSIKFEVQIDGKYDELIWMKDGEQINVDVGPDATTDDDDDTSTIVGDDDVALDDVHAGKPKRRFAPKILRRPRNVVAGPGSRVAFEVQFSGEPKPTVVWFKNGERVTESGATSESAGKIIIEEVGEDVVRLIIEDVQESDVASYQVLVENPYGSERSPLVRLELDNDMVASDDLANSSAEQPVDSATGQPLKRGRAPRILSRPKSVHAPPGSKVAFEVQVSGEPTPIVNWFRDGRLITQTSDGHVTIEEYSNGCVRLVLSDITDSDVAQYHVVAENKMGSERTIPVTLTIDESGAKPTDNVGKFEEIATLDDQVERRKRGGRPPRIVLRPKHLQTTPGSEVVLEVTVVGQSKPSIIWYKNGTRITNSADGRVRIEQISDGYQKLVISNVKETDAGEYSVSAENDFGVAMSEKVKMTVSKSVVEETTTTTTTTESFFEQFVDDSTADSSDRPTGGRKPRFTVRPRNRKAPIGSKVDFEVCVKGEPKPDVIWYKNGRRIHTTSDGRVRVEEFSDGGHKLVIEDLEETDHGVYAAEARNEWGSERTEDVQLRVTQRTEVSERTEVSQRGSARVTTKTKKTRSHYTFAEERHGYVTLTINDAQMDHDGDYKLIVRNKWGEASTQAPLVVIPKVEPRSSYSMDRHSTTTYDDSEGGRDSRNRRTPFDELEDYGHELDKSVGIFGSESRYQSGDDTYLLQLRDTEFPLRLRKYLRFGARQSPSLRSNLMDAHWGAGARVTIRERRKFREVMDEEIDDEKRGLDLRPTPMRLQKEVGTCGYAAAQLEHLRVEAAERVARQSVEGDHRQVDMMPPFFRVKLKDAVIEETSARTNHEAVFVCQAAGQPAPEYTWFRNDIIITDVHRMQIVQNEDGSSELHIRDPRLHDSGCFKCVARNVHGNVTSRARLRVASRPSRPEPPEYVSVTAREVFLQWRPPRDYDVNAAEVLGYKLEMSQSSIGEQDQWTTLAADIGHEFYVVDDLTPATSYSFRLTARNKFGWSESSYSTYVTTCRADAAATGAAEPGRLNVPHEMRARQYTADICDLHLLRHCEDPLRPSKLNYQLEQNPIKLNGSDGNERLSDAYTLQAEIARGRFSVISKAVAKRAPTDEDEIADSRQVTIKAVLVDSMSAAQTKNEFDILRSLQHEKVVRLQAAYKDDDMFVFVMDRLSGLDVLTYLSSFSSYNEDTVSKIITQVMDAIEYLHFRGMCLLELLPDNVVMANGRSTALKLVDFSSARFVPRSGARVPSNASQNIEYCPPEVIAGHEVSTASDVWCIGVLTYVLLSGFSPFKGETEEETRENVRLGRYKYDHIYGNCTPEVTRFLINVFKKHSSKRPTIEQLYENKWLLPNEFMIRKRQQANFKTDKIVVFAEEFHKFKTQTETAPQRLTDLLSSK